MNNNGNYAKRQKNLEKILPIIDALAIKVQTGEISKEMFKESVNDKSRKCGRKTRNLYATWMKTLQATKKRFQRNIPDDIDRQVAEIQRKVDPLFCAPHSQVSATNVIPSDNSVNVCVNPFNRRSRRSRNPSPDYVVVPPEVENVDELRESENSNQLPEPEPVAAQIGQQLHLAAPADVPIPAENDINLQQPNGVGPRINGAGKNPEDLQALIRLHQLQADNLRQLMNLF